MSMLPKGTFDVVVTFQCRLVSLLLFVLLLGWGVIKMSDFFLYQL